MLTFRRSTPAARRGAASSASRWPLVDSAMSRMPGIARSRRTSATRSRRTVGSPPVSRTRRTPSARSTRTSAAISSKESMSARSTCVDAVLGHAVGAAVVAAIGDRDAQVVDHARLGIDQAVGARGPRPPRAQGAPGPTVLVLAWCRVACRAAARPCAAARAYELCSASARPPASPAAETPAVPTSPASARDSIAAGPISSNDSARNSSPKPGRRRSKSPATASSVLSRGEMPVPPVTSTASLRRARQATDVAQRGPAPRGPARRR